MSLKYIVFDDAFPIVFGEYFSHKDVELRSRRLAIDAGGKGQLTGAGFVGGLDGLDWFAYGHSESLDKGPGTNDNEILTRMLNKR